MEAPGDLCLVCENPNASACSRCKSARYCSKKCQKADWPTHKLLCAAFAGFTSARPTDQHFRAIFFPVGEAKPHFIWLEKGRISDFLGFDTIVGGSGTIERPLPVNYNPILKRKIYDTIWISSRDTFLIDGSKPNMSVKAITATKTGEHFDWRGPIVAYGEKGPGHEFMGSRDLDMTDFRHIADYFLWYEYKSPPSTPEPRGKPGTQEPHDKMVKGVRINCSGDEKVCGRPHFEAVEIPLSDSIFSEHFTSDIADRIGLPIITRKCSPDPKWSRGGSIDGEIPTNNQDATFLHLCCDPKAKLNRQTGQMGWGWAPKQWQTSFGSAIVVRKDKKPLLPLHVEALCRYCRYEISPLMAHTLGEYAPDEPMSKDLVLSFICRPTFSILWYKLVMEKSKEKADTSAPFPYEI